MWLRCVQLLSFRHVFVIMYICFELDVYSSVFCVIFIYIIQFRPAACSVTSVATVGSNDMVRSL